MGAGGLNGNRQVFFHLWVVADDLLQAPPADEQHMRLLHNFQRGCFRPCFKERGFVEVLVSAHTAQHLGCAIRQCADEPPLPIQEQVQPLCLIPLLEHGFAHVKAQDAHCGLCPFHMLGGKGGKKW